MDLYVQRRKPDGTQAGDLASGTSGSLTDEQMNMGRLSPGTTYRIGRTCGRAPATSIAIRATFFNSAGLAGP